MLDGVPEDHRIEKIRWKRDILETAREYFETFAAANFC